VVVSPEYQDKGLGTLLINEIVELAAEFGLEKLWAELPLNVPAAIAVFRKAGFSSKAVVEGLVKDLRGRNTDVVIMVCDIGAQYDF
jgi:ribosomal protein S18 acetylase RimI-like enzyme